MTFPLQAKIRNTTFAPSAGDNSSPMSTSNNATRAAAVDVSPGVKPLALPMLTDKPDASTPTTQLRKRQKEHPCPYECTDANGKVRRFTCRHDVSQHIREKHTHSRPYKCRICGSAHRGFNRPFCLNRHLTNVHHLNIEPGRGRIKKSKMHAEGLQAPLTTLERDSAVRRSDESNFFNKNPDQLESEAKGANSSNGSLH